jgi:thiol-disulfide isomerase/thioredoxin
MTAFSSLLVLAALGGTDDVVLVQFSSQHCTHCQAMQPVLERMIGEGCPVQAIDVDQQPDVARQFRITGVPTYVLLNRGQEAGRIVGSASYERLVQLYRGQAPAGAAAPEEQAGVQPNVVQQTAAQQPAAQPVSHTPPTAKNADPQQAALAASVRLKVEDATGFGYGTGTIIDVHGEEALVVTCGHIFRESQGKGNISVDLFAPGATQPVAGQLIAYDLDRDIALVSIRPGIAITAATVAPPGTTIRPQDRAFTVGCDKGAAATVRQSHITAVNKYQGRPNLTAAGAPVDGRSGGGLFTAEGLLIGICNAADPADDEGLYAALASIHWQLDQIGQSEIYQRGAQAVDAGAVAASEPAAQPVAAEEPAMPALPAAMPQRSVASAEHANTAVTPAVFQPSAAAGAASRVSPASFEQVAATDDDTEIVFIVRSKRNPQVRSEVYVVEQATPDLISRISEAARNSGQQRAAAAHAMREASTHQPLQTAHQHRQPATPVVRGQSTDY